MCVNDGIGSAGDWPAADGLDGVPAGQIRPSGGGTVTIYRILSNETYKGTWWYGKARYISTEDGIQGPR